MDANLVGGYFGFCTTASSAENKKHKTNKKREKMNRKLLMMLSLVAVLTAVNSNAACYKIVNAVCHAGTPGSTPTCCLWDFCFDGSNPPTYQTPCCIIPGTKTWTETNGYILTCALNGNNIRLGGSNNGTCNWTESGTECGLPYGPISKESPTTFFNCYNPTCSTTGGN